jgi:hypothetical protein
VAAAARNLWGLRRCAPYAPLLARPASDPNQPPRRPLRAGAAGPRCGAARAAAPSPSTPRAKVCPSAPALPPRADACRSHQLHPRIARPTPPARPSAHHPTLPPAALLAAGADAQAAYNSFSPYLSGWSASGCARNGTEIYRVGIGGCTQMAPKVYVVGSCSFEETDKSASFVVCSDAVCSQNCAPGPVKMSFACAGTGGAGALAGEAAVSIHCSAAPTDAAAAAIVGMAVVIGLATIGMLAMWVMKDKRDKARREKAAAEAAKRGSYEPL